MNKKQTLTVVVSLNNTLYLIRLKMHAIFYWSYWSSSMIAVIHRLKRGPVESLVNVMNGVVTSIGE